MGNNSYAIGGGNTIGSATITETTEANGDKIKKVTAGTVKGSTAGAFGYKNTVTTDNAYVVGNNSTASADGAMVLGSSASVTGKNGVALGNNTKVANENAVAIGNGSETAAAVATPSATINGVAHNFAGVNPASTVSVGKAGSERTITNVAAGRISATSTDAINGSQLYAVTTEIDKGVAYAGDVKAAAAAANKFTRKLGEQTNIIGGVTDTSKLTDGNIGVVSNGTDTLNIKLAKDVKVDSVTTGNTVINNNGLTVGGKTYVTNNGINANNQKVTNVADGQVAAGSKDAVNGGQLHDAKNEVINKGLRFDADNNSEKTNKLGSKVTVNGDNNITTEITQTGEDTKIGVKLKEDIHVKTVTATDTVKAGGVTMGSQTSGGTTGNYVTGLDNKTWNVTNPTAVSGRAATEDQLKTVTEAINNQSAAATDYRLVQNASSADGSYTVDTNGNIDLTVEDKNHAGQKETVKLKDIASKSKLDDVIAKGLQFDANAGGTKTNKLGSKITVKGEGTAADTEYSGENLKTFITQDPAGNTTIDVKMNKNLKVETIVATGENGKDGKIGINGKDGVTTNISVTRDGKPGVDGAPGTTTTRIVYEKPDGTKEEVATLNDGMKYGGDTGNVIKKKLNEQVNVVGGITDENKLTTEDNLGVVSDGNNNLKVRLAKALKGLESITAGDTFINNNGITISNGAAGNTVSLTKDGLDNGGNKITNVAAGDVSANSTDAVNGSQLHDVKTLAGQHTTVKAKDSNITVTEGTNGTGGKEYTVGLGDKVTLGTDPSKQVSIDGTTGIIKAGDKVTIDGTTGNIDAGKVKINGKDGTVNGLTNKTWDPNNITSGQAATEDQLKAVDQKITNTSEELTKKGMDFAGNDGEFHRNLGDKVTIKGEGTKAASEYSGENIKTFADANGNLTVKMDKNLKTETIVATGKNGKDGKIGINGKDGVTTNISVTRDGKPGVDGAPGTTTTRIVYEKPDGTKEEVATLNDGMKYGGDTGNVIKKKLNEQVNVVGGITDENKLTTEDNLGVVSDGNNNLKVRMAKDLKGLNSVTTNTLTVGDVKIDNSGINAGNKKITNVAAGDISANSTDAVNGGQLWKTNQTINNIGGVVNELGDRMDRVGAGAAALAALHPLDFDPDDKWDVAAGYGNYKDAHAVAVGAFYRPNEDTMFSVGGSFGGGENMVNAGVSVKLGQGNHVSTSRVALAKEVEDLKAIVKAQSAEIKAMRGAMQSGASVMKDVNFPDVPKDHWAYSYVKSLADRGLLEGYPDGEFKGDRSMTRYEFAAIIYRALQNGAPIDSDMAKAIGEFDPEINRIKDLDRTRVDRISGKDNDRHKVERVRVNNESNKEKGDYRDVYGSHISPEA
ncbi:S-layer homology domain-containing protein [Dialister invisus]|uniref:S-layer homology domain-containing protein n=1 Tax=Dialister invisus TaxID=218538 RepID=UPI00351FBC26